MRLQRTSEDARILARLRKLCLALPGAAETLTWGHPNFRVDGKIFAGYGLQAGHRTISGKVGKDRQRTLIRDRRYLYSDYVGRFGWVSFILEGRIDWNEVAGLMLSSYRLIATRKRLADLERESTDTVRRGSIGRRKGGRRRQKA